MKHVYIALLVYTGLTAVDDPSLHTPPTPWPQGVAHLLGTPRAIQLAFLRDQFIQHHPEATQHHIDQHMRTVERELHRWVCQFLAEQMVRPQ